MTEHMRPSWDETWLQVAHVMALRSSCPRAHVGVVIVSPENVVLSTGYNGSPAGQPHCVDAGCIVDKDGSCVRTVHAEVNAVMRAGSLTRGATVYTTVSPCWRCAVMLVQAGVARVVAASSYRRVTGFEDPVEFLRSSGVEVTLAE